MKRQIAQWIYKYLSGNPSEWHCIPGSEVELDFGEVYRDQHVYRATTYNNDGFELWIAYTHESKWVFHCRAEDARRLAWFILWRWWAVSTWFGLKRKLWYWANRYLLDYRIKRNGAQP